MDTVEPYATTLARLARFEEAAELLERYPPTTPRGHLLFARILLDANRPAQAVTVVERALEAAPEQARGGPMFLELQAVGAQARARLSAGDRDGGPPP